MLMTALNLTKYQATTAITEALNEGDEDKDTDISRFQQVQEAFPKLRTIPGNERHCLPRAAGGLGSFL